MTTSTTQRAAEARLRPGKPEDAEVLGNICYDAFTTISKEHNFPPDFPGPEVTLGFMQMMLSLPGVYSVVAEDDGGNVVGSNFLWEQDTIAGIGPITVDVKGQNASFGRAMMEDVIRRCDEKGYPAVRLVQAAFHNRSLSLYTKLGFNTVEPLSNMQGPALGLKIDGYNVRAMTTDDLGAVDELAFKVHGHTRHNEVVGAIEHGTARVVENGGRITGYTTGVGFFGHSVGESNRDLEALIGAAEEFPGSGFHLPTRNGDLMRWCLAHGIRVVQPFNLMSRGVYQDPRGAFLPSILY